MEIPKRVKMIWGEWSIRLFILLSLFSQIVLVLLAPLRKKKQQNRIARFIWLVYLLADWVAIFTLGLLSNNQNDDSSGLNGRDDLLALWAPFLLLHLGGPDTITAFALEDNELWLRHLIGLIYQLIPAGYVFIRSFPTNTLLVPTIFIFPVGIVKYVERTLSLYGASFDALNTECMNPMRGSGLKIFRFGQDFVDVNGQGWEDQVTGTKILQYAYYLFHNFKGIVADHMLNLFHLIKSREVFLMWSANDAFKVIEIELSFLYEMLYTKAVVVHSRVGYVFRFICFIFITIALCDFFFLKKHKFHESDIKITYTLLIGAVSLEATGLFNLIFSDWSVIHLTNSQSGVASFIVKYHKLLFDGPRWSESVSQLNLISFCLNKRPVWLEKMVVCLHIKSMLDEFHHKSCKRVTEKLRIRIYEELRAKAESSDLLEDLKNLVPCRGQWVIKNSADYCQVLNWSVEVEFVDSILIWHIATEIIYQITIKDVAKMTTDDHRNANGNERKTSKLLSDYVFYLMVMQPNTMPSMGRWMVKYQETCQDVEAYFCPDKFETRQTLEERCETLVSEVEPLAHGNNSMFWKAVQLAKELNELDISYRWSLMSSVWVEILGYAASHCRGYAHAQQLSKGGELLTFVWLLMAHLGIIRDYVE